MAPVIVDSLIKFKQIFVIVYVNIWQYVYSAHLLISLFPRRS